MYHDNGQIIRLRLLLHGAIDKRDMQPLEFLFLHLTIYHILRKLKIFGGTTHHVLWKALNHVPTHNASGSVKICPNVFLVLIYLLAYLFRIFYGAVGQPKMDIYPISIHGGNGLTRM